MSLDGWTGAGAPDLLLALDYDGTLVPIVDRPEDARPDAELLALLDDLVAARGTDVLVISGRSLAVLDGWIDRPDITLIGTHGAEWRPPRGSPEPFLAPPEAEVRAAEAATDLSNALAGLSGAEVEWKRFGAAAHFRRVPEARRSNWHGRVAPVLARHVPPFESHEGKCVLELRWPGVDKGRALDTARRRLGWEAVPVLCAGDDRTDEATFAALGPADLTIHVGDGPTGAARRVADAAELRGFLRDLLRRRAETGGDR